MICLDHVIAGEKPAAECGGGGYLSQEYQSDKELVSVETPSVGQEHLWTLEADIFPQKI